MMKAKKILIILLALSLIFAIASCGGGGNDPCTACVDGNGDGKCDKCQKDMPQDTIEDILLFEDDEPLFQIVVSKDCPSEVLQAANTNIKMMLRNKLGVTVSVVSEGSASDTPQDTEILIGNVSSRGDKYLYDQYSLGKRGYLYTIVGSKVIINAGSTEMLCETIGEFADEIFLKDDDLSYLVMTEADCVIEPQSDYLITSLSINGTNLRGYKIAADITRDFYEDVAIALRDQLYERTGYWLDIIDLENATEKSIIIKHNSLLPDEESYKAYASGSQFIIECSYDNMLSEKTEEFAASCIYSKDGAVDLKDSRFTDDISVLFYEDRGARGDGITDDFKAIYDTHVLANISGQTVKAKPGSVFYIMDTKLQTTGGAKKAHSVPIKTNVDWQGAKFIIDDTDIATFSGGPNYDLQGTQIFSVQHDSENAGVTFKDRAVLDQLVMDGFNTKTTKIDFSYDGWEKGLMLVPYNNEHKIFRRRGYGAHSGEDMHELIIIDKDGNIDTTTPIMFEYSHINYMKVYKLDPDTAITIKNATIETRESTVNHMRNGTYSGGYKARGIMVQRSYTTVENITHVVTGGFNLKQRANGYEGPAANGMFRAQNANQVTFKNCIVPGRQSYGRHSSYNFGGNLVNKIVMDGCIQSNFWISVDFDTGIMTGSEEYVAGAYPSMSSVTMRNDNGDSVSVMMHWGIGGTNYCKNMEYLNSKISRYDAHQGLYNGKIINTSINGMELTGDGELIIENVDWYPYSTTTPLLYLRSDYGYHWNGDIEVKDTRAHLFDAHGGTPKLIIAYHRYANWYFGYTATFPNITLDNLSVWSQKTQTQMGEGFEAHLFEFKSGAKKMHLTGDAGANVILDYVDSDGNGYIDEPLYDMNLDGTIDEIDKAFDIDQNGDPNNTKLKMSDYAHLSSDTLDSGVSYSGCKTNVNIVRPPKYIKIINNNAKIVYRVVNTNGVSDGGWNRDPGTVDTMRGFFGNTKFYYGTGENDYFLSSNHTGQSVTSTYKFVSSYY